MHPPLPRAGWHKVLQFDLLGLCKVPLLDQHCAPGRALKKKNLVANLDTLMFCVLIVPVRAHRHRQDTMQVFGIIFALLTLLQVNGARPICRTACHEYCHKENLSGFLEGGECMTEFEACQHCCNKGGHNAQDAACVGFPSTGPGSSGECPSSGNQCS